MFWELLIATCTGVCAPGNISSTVTPLETIEKVEDVAITSLVLKQQNSVQFAVSNSSKSSKIRAENLDELVVSSFVSPKFQNAVTIRITLGLVMLQLDKAGVEQDFFHINSPPPDAFKIMEWRHFLSLFDGPVSKSKEKGKRRVLLSRLKSFLSGDGSAFLYGESFSSHSKLTDAMLTPSEAMRERPFSSSVADGRSVMSALSSLKIAYMFSEVGDKMEAVFPFFAKNGAIANRGRCDCSRTPNIYVVSQKFNTQRGVFSFWERFSQGRVYPNET